MHIAYTKNGKELVANLAPGVNPEKAAIIMALAPDNWRVIPPEEAAELQKPTPEEIAAQEAAAAKARIAEIDAVLAAINARQARVLSDERLGVIEADFASGRLQALEAEASELRDERSGLALSGL